MKRAKRLTKRERKQANGLGAGPGPSADTSAHIHCIACGRHLSPGEFSATPATARYLRCQHGTAHPACGDCAAEGAALLREHDRTGQPVRAAAAWH